MKSIKALIIAALVIALACAGWFYRASFLGNSEQQRAAIQLENNLKNLHDMLANYRKIIVLMDNIKNQSEPEKKAITSVGQQIFHANIELTQKTNQELSDIFAAQDPNRAPLVTALLDYIESDNGLFDADRLAFKEWLRSAKTIVAADSSLNAIKLHKRISEDIDALNEIEHNYEKELGQIYSNLNAQRGIELKRQKWDAYVTHVNTLVNRTQILKEYGVILPDLAKIAAANSAAANAQDDERNGEIYGNKLPPKTIVLTFDDGPHKAYTEQITAILQQYDVPGTFFNIGKNLGKIDATGAVKLNSNAAITRTLIEQGYVVGNHSFSHAKLSSLTGEPLQNEISNTDAILKAVSPARSALFRFPYGARNDEGLQYVQKENLKSVMWNIDSLDWADPVPTSIVERVLNAVEKQQKGILLFHDIHDRAVKALPTILDKLIADGYQFAAWNGHDFEVKKSNKTVATQALKGGYSNSWAIVIGINDYQHWPKLQYAVQDAKGVRKMLIDKLGFASDHVISLENNDATRNNILSVFHDRLGHDNVAKDERIFVFFAGHGATKRLNSGRDLGYIIPVDSDPNQFDRDAIAMSEIQNISESLNAKHILFVMDACYSGLGLTRGGSNFLRDNAKRIGRQMLTAGGADQLVSDGGPNGHSIFTWTLLQGLSGKADLNGDGIITATELAAYVAPAVAAVSQQTPAFGSLPGSEGGDFVFELPDETEFITTATTQLSADAIKLNTQLDATRPTVAVDDKKQGQGQISAPPQIAVKVKDLQGTEQTLKPVIAAPASARQMAQRANDRGLQLYKEAKYAQAEAEFTNALQLRPDFALAANNLGFVFYKQNKYAEAARWFQNAIKLDPSRAIAYLNLGDALFNLGDKENAKKSYQTFLELNPKSSSEKYVRGQLDKL